MSFVHRIATWLSRAPLALVACALLAAAVILPGLGGPGLWEPQERQLADRLAPPIPSATTPATTPAPSKPTAACPRTAADDAYARTLTARAIKWGRDTFGDSDAGRRWPLAVLGWLTVLALAATALRLAGPRAALVTTLVVLAMPLLVLQARMLTSEIGTPCGAALLVYGLVALGDRRPGQRAALAALDLAVAIVAIAAGGVIGFVAGGALLGLLVPLGAIALAGHRRPGRAGAIVVVLAALAAGALVAVLAHQLYDLKPLYPGLTPPPAREVLGRAIIPTNCYSSALGGLWRPDDDLHVIFDGSFEQIAYGTFPWGLLAPIAMALLLAAPDPRRRRAGALGLAWAGAAWLAGEVFLRKVGFTVYAGFPALALAIGVWLDDLLARRDAPAGGRLIALFFALGVIDLGKDLQSFTDKLTSLLIGNDGVPYPMPSRFGFLPTRLWLLVLGVLVAAGVVVALVARRPGARDRLATGGAIGALAVSVALAVFWSAVWQPRIATHVSSKAILETYQALARPGDPLVVLGDLGQAPLAYTGKPAQPASDRTQIIAALGKPDRVFAIAPQSELCAIHREIAGKPYYVIDDRNQRSLLLSNKLDGATDLNPLRTAIVHDEPKAISARPKGRVVFDNKIQLLGWDLPRTIGRGAPTEVTVYYKILAPISGSWKAFMHFDGAAGRAGNGDHEPIAGRCPTSTWQNGDYIVDRFTVRVGGGAFPGGRYDVWLGFFTGTAPSFKNMPVSEAPGDMRDSVDRVKIANVTLD
ncbi:MAG TPA: hypothetical protein VFP84_18020 [Kofleriaceae bacterium]|nr:hypothetical protein [Kofleriaceae bacterium]